MLDYINTQAPPGHGPVLVRLINMDKKRLPYRVFLWDYSRPRRDTWCHEIKTIVELCGLRTADWGNFTLAIQ